MLFRSLLIIAVIGKLGVETTSFAALLASAGVAIGMALSGNLQNFAGGLIYATGTAVFLSSGHQLPISRRKRQEFNQNFNAYLGR